MLPYYSFPYSFLSTNKKNFSHFSFGNTFKVNFPLFSTQNIAADLKCCSQCTYTWWWNTDFNYIKIRRRKFLEEQLWVWIYFQIVSSIILHFQGCLLYPIRNVSNTKRKEITFKKLHYCIQILMKGGMYLHSNWKWGKFIDSKVECVSLLKFSSVIR